MKYPTLAERARLATLLLLFLTTTGAMAYSYKLYVTTDNTDWTSPDKVRIFDVSEDRLRKDTYNTDANPDFSKYLYTAGVKDDMLPGTADSYVYWQIRKFDDNGSLTAIYAPIYSSGNSDQYELASDSNSGTKKYEGHLSWETYDNIVSGNTNTTVSFKLKRGSGVSYTFALCAGDRDKRYSYTWEYGSQSVQLTVNKGSFSTSGTGYYLVGNLKNANSGDAWTVTDKSYYRDMARIDYKNPTDENVTDSVVYQVNIAKPANGWGNLFIGFLDKDYWKSNGADFNSGNDQEKIAAWNHLIRPEVHENFDGTALEGALLRYSDLGVSPNKNMSINPLLTDEQAKKYTSYTVRFNATTKTYNIVFNEGLYIVGTAVKEAGYGWDLDQAKELTYDATKQCYTGKVTLKAGCKFAFIKDKSYQYVYFEDTDQPGTDYAPQSADGDVFYNNQLLYNINPERAGVTGKTDANRDPLLDIEGGNDSDTRVNSVVLFQTPELAKNGEAEYEIHFYENMPNDPESSEPFYTLNRKVKLVKNPKAESTDNNVLRAFATNYPLEYDDDDLKLYVVDKYDKTNMTVHLTDVTSTYVLNGQKYIPAKVPLLLIKSVSTDTQTESGNTISLSCRPFINLSATNAYTGTNLLEGIYTLDDRQVCFTYPAKTDGDDSSWATGDKVDARGYLFVLMATKDNSGNVTAYVPAFRRTKSGQSTTERAFLKVASSESDGDTTFNPTDKASYAYNQGGSSIDAGTAQSAKYAYLLDFSDDETTGITTLQPVQDGDDAWYNLGGQRVGQPAKGIYIHQGRKVVVR